MDLFKSFKIYISKKIVIERKDVTMKQLTVLLLGVVAMIFVGLFPPWNYTIDFQQFHYQRPTGNFSIFITSLPHLEEFQDYYGLRIDIARLVIQWALIAFVIVALFLILRIRSLKDPMKAYCYCPKCQALTDTHASFCRECGKNLIRERE